MHMGFSKNGVDFVSLGEVDNVTFHDADSSDRRRQHLAFCIPESRTYEFVVHELSPSFREVIIELDECAVFAELYRKTIADLAALVAEADLKLRKATAAQKEKLLWQRKHTAGVKPHVSQKLPRPPRRQGFSNRRSTLKRALPSTRKHRKAIKSLFKK